MPSYHNYTHHTYMWRDGETETHRMGEMERRARSHAYLHQVSKSRRDRTVKERMQRVANNTDQPSSTDFRGIIKSTVSGPVTPGQISCYIDLTLGKQTCKCGKELSAQTNYRLRGSYICSECIGKSSEDVKGEIKVQYHWDHCPICQTKSKDDHTMELLFTTCGHTCYRRDYECGFCHITTAENALVLAVERAWCGYTFECYVLRMPIAPPSHYPSIPLPLHPTTPPSHPTSQAVVLLRPLQYIVVISGSFKL
ncbi:uncharacterized protein TRIVIDRAFT_203421 [Trichoderma virens Gv29-8]|uniref:Uncharacterized protein n=1 Tax=Hypocrea virens (strain Gv29-8 / FGSC 10586) TaxID=413071 RepID=G9N0H0_HYPVG|nr:uncharacterized protein TRIVIDRAFT_203421 [Trichoderma virens Gv29-8]EHK19852.1 hypothetical protein TRIVIDRAFT_203421 [Trichoderma virens Gv29-8]